MTFLSEAPAAIPVLQHSRFNAVFAGLHMAGMDGPALLNEVRTRHPATLRILLTDDRGHERVLRSAALAHEVLARPCEPKAAQASLQRAQAWETSPASARLRSLFAQMDFVPALPAPYQELLEITARPGESLRLAAQVIQQNGLEAEFVVWANILAPGRNFLHAPEAIGFLGWGTTKSLVLALGVFAAFPVEMRGEVSREFIWRHSFSVALLTRQVGETRRADPLMRSEAFLAALLHDVGRPLLVVNFPDAYQQLVEQRRRNLLSLEQMEKEYFQIDHGQAGGWLLRNWHLPSTIIEAVAYHHQPRDAVNTEFSPLTLVHLANCLSLGEPSKLDHQYLGELGLANQLESWIQLSLKQKLSLGL
jgi:HD-like signal output (HDOD) protein